MQIKGTAVKSTSGFVKEKFEEHYKEWLNNLPDVSRKIILEGVYSGNWYPLTEAVIIPTEKVGEMFFEGDSIKAARELGRYSSELALKGIYKFFVRVSNPHFVLSRARSVFSAYYDKAEINVLENQEKKATLKFSGFDEKDKLIIYRIAGWIEKTLEITLKAPLYVDVQSNTTGSLCTFIITVEWD